MLKHILICLVSINIAYCHPLSIWGSDSSPGEAPNSMFRSSLGNIFSVIPNPSHITNAIPFLNGRVNKPSSAGLTRNTQQSYEFKPQRVPVYTETIKSENGPAIVEPHLTDKYSPKSELDMEHNPTSVETVSELQESNYDADSPESLPEPVYQQFPEDNTLILQVIQSTENFGDYSTYTTEDYESTTLDVDVFNRMGAPPPAVVASLLG